MSTDARIEALAEAIVFGHDAATTLPAAGDPDAVAACRATMTGIDPDAGAGADGGVGADAGDPIPAPGCACRAAPSSSMPGPLALLLVGLLARRRVFLH